MPGFPEMVSHLTKQPNFYCSHSFCNILLFNVYNATVARVDAFCLELDGKCPVRKPEDAVCEIPYVPKAANNLYGKVLDDTDYMWRPDNVSAMPWYFFASSMESTKDGPALPWHICTEVKMATGRHTLQRRF